MERKPDYPLMIVCAFVAGVVGYGVGQVVGLLCNLSNANTDLRSWILAVGFALTAVACSEHTP